LGGTIAQPEFIKNNPNAVEYKRMVHVQQKDPLNPDAPVINHLVPYENLPKNVANQKDVRTALSGLNKTPVYGQQQSQQGGMVKVRLNGKVGQIPAGNLKKFKSEYPDAELLNE